MWYHDAMKKGLIILISFLMILSGCRGKAKDTEATPAPTESIRVEIAAITPTPAEAPQYTPWPYPSDEDIFVPQATEAPTPEPTDVPALTPAAERYAVAEGVETVAWMSDTQHYANYSANGLSPEIYPAMTGFLRDKAEEMHLIYVVHTGDLVHRNDSEENWKVARAAMDLLDGIPTGVLAGNHDMDPAKGGYKHYGQYFGEKQYGQQACYGESFENNRGHYDLGVLCLHDFITTEGTLSEAGQQLREQVVAKCPNVYLVLCGHRYGLYTLEDAFDDDGDGVKERTVYEIMMNYQAAGKEGGGGYLRLMQFDEAAQEIRCVNYSPYLHDYDWLDDPTHKEKRYEMDEKSESFILKMPWA